MYCWRHANCASWGQSGPQLFASSISVSELLPPNAELQVIDRWGDYTKLAEPSNPDAPAGLTQEEQTWQRLARQESLTITHSEITNDRNKAAMFALLCHTARKYEHAALCLQRKYLSSPRCQMRAAVGSHDAGGDAPGREMRCLTAEGQLNETAQRLQPGTTVGRQGQLLGGPGTAQEPL